MSKFHPHRVQDIAYVLDMIASENSAFMPDRVQFQDKNDGEIRLVYTAGDDE